MTHRTIGFGRAFPRAWLVPIGALTILLGVAASGRLSRSIVADLIAWWPVWLGLGITAYLLRERKFGSFRAAGLVPLIALAFVLLFTWGHLAGWSLMPSSSQRLVGPELGAYTEASLVAEVDGRIEIAGGSEFLYQVEPIKNGGGIAIPGAQEQVTANSVDVILQEPPEAGLYGYAGWDISISPTPAWTLTLDGAVDADLRELNVTELSVAGSGRLSLGTSSGTTPVSVFGSFRVVVPAGDPATVIGVAAVPANWVLTQRGARAPIDGDGWVITVVGDASVTVSEG